MFGSVPNDNIGAANIGSEARYDGVGVPSMTFSNPKKRLPSEFCLLRAPSPLTGLFVGEH